MENLRKYLKKIDDVIEHGKFKDNWESLANHPVPTWYRNAKFGLFVHWGPYSVPAYQSEWYPRFMYKQLPSTPEKLSAFDHHVKTYGKHKDFGYKDFIPMFTADKFDPAALAKLFKESGARFIMPIAEHHDGFQMYDSELSEWCATKMGPKKDILAMFKEEVEKEGMVFTASSHRIEHYWFMGGMRDFESDIPNGGDIPYGHLYWPSYKEPYDTTIKMGHRDIDVEVEELFMEDWLARTCEIVDKYQPKIMYFDWWIQVAPLKPYLKKFMAYYYNRAEEWGEEVTVNYKHDAFAMTTGVSDIERGQLGDVSPYFWQNDTAVAKNSWCYTVGNDYKTPYDILCDLVDVVSKNGSLMLNIGPKADGTMPEEDEHILREIGKWLKANGEAIYESYPYKIYGEGPTKTAEGHHTDILRAQYTEEDYRFTSKVGKIYVFAMKWPADGVLKIHNLGKRMGKYNAVLKKVTMLGENRECEFMLCDNYLTIIGGKVNTEYPVCLRLDID